MLALWYRLPTSVRAILGGAALAAAGTTPWALLASANLAHAPSVPWAVPPTALWLWLLWRWARGAGWPRETARARRDAVRANRVPDDAWGAALLAGLLGLGAVTLLMQVTNRLVALPPQRVSDLSRVPTPTVLLLLATGAAVAGIVEEMAFRGVMQRGLERRHGPVAAILATGLLFGLAHFGHPEVGVALLPYYMAVAAVYGTLAYLTDSILPGLALHAGGNLFLSVLQVLGGATRAEWQAPATPAPTVWATGPDAAFWGAVVGTAVVGAAAVGAFVALAAVTRDARSARSDAVAGAALGAGARGP
jgi:hypothetical protein